MFVFFLFFYLFAIVFLLLACWHCEYALSIQLCKSVQAQQGTMGGGTGYVTLPMNSLPG